MCNPNPFLYLLWLVNTGGNIRGLPMFSAEVSALSGEVYIKGIVLVLTMLKAIS